MKITPHLESSMLHMLAERIDEQRAKLPAGGSPFVLPDPVDVGNQLAELGRIVTELGDEYLFRAADPAPTQYTVRAAEVFANAGGSAAQAASALGTVAMQLAFVARTAGLRGEARYEEAHTMAGQTAEYAVETARNDLAEAAQILRTGAAEISLPPAKSTFAHSPRAASVVVVRPATSPVIGERPAPGGGLAEQPGPSVRVSAALSRSTAPQSASKAARQGSFSAALGASAVARALPPASPHRRSTP